MGAPQKSMAIEKGAVTLTHACEYLDIAYETARRRRLFETWEEIGLMWTIPGTTIRRVDMDKLKAWKNETQEQQNAERFTDLAWLDNIGKR